MTYFTDESKEPIGRELTVLDYIEKFPNSNHNSLMKQVVINDKLMAKKTFEKTIHSLIEKGIVKSFKSKNMKIYVRIDDFKENYDITLEKATGTMFRFLEHEIKRIENSYKSMSIEEKVFNIAYHFRNVLQTDSGFTILDSMKNRDDTLYVDEHQKNQQFIARLLSIVKNDKDFLTVYPVVMNSIGIFPPQDYKGLEQERKEMVEEQNKQNS